MAERTEFFDLLRATAKSGGPLTMTIEDMEVTITVKVLEPDPQDYRVHPAAMGRQLGNRARSVGR